jgi:hypothetical protein
MDMNKRSQSQFHRRSKERIERYLDYLASANEHYISPVDQSTCVPVRLKLPVAILLDLYAQYQAPKARKAGVELSNLIEKTAINIKQDKKFKAWVSTQIRPDGLRLLGFD